MPHLAAPGQEPVAVKAHLAAEFREELGLGRLALHEAPNRFRVDPGHGAQLGVGVVSSSNKQSVVEACAFHKRTLPPFPPKLQGHTDVDFFFGPKFLTDIR